MRIYFVRHGEGDHNINGLYSTPDFELTDLGKSQAEGVSKRLTTLPINVIVTSPYKRTLQTTDIINKVLNKKVLTSDLVIEIVRPSEIAGQVMKGNLEIEEIKKQMDENISNPNWHYSNEENFFDFRKRAIEFLEYISSFKEEHILVVSHVLFIRIAVLVMMMGEDLTPEIYLKSQKFLELETSGLTICDKDASGWKLITWNDHAHLADTKVLATG